jgi:hypothetical protein
MFQADRVLTGCQVSPNDQDFADAMAKLRRLLTQNLNLTELKVVCFDIGVDFDSLSGDDKAAKIVELLLYLRRHNELQRLIKCIQEDCDHIKLSPDILIPIDRLSQAMDPNIPRHLETRLEKAFKGPDYKRLTSSLSPEKRRKLDELIREYVSFANYASSTR